jgi:light-harvesting protein B-800-850 alpha chain
MIYGKLWCVVKPSVGIPLFLGAVAVSSFAVHLTLLRHAPWLQNFVAGKAAVVATAPADAGGAAAAAPAPKK